MLHTDVVHQADRWLDVGEFTKPVLAEQKEDFSNRSAPSATPLFAKLNSWPKDIRELTTSDIGGRSCFEGCTQKTQTIIKFFNFLLSLNYNIRC